MNNEPDEFKCTYADPKTHTWEEKPSEQELDEKLKSYGYNPEQVAQRGIELIRSLKIKHGMMGLTKFQTKQIKNLWYCYATHRGYDYSFCSDNEYHAVELAKRIMDKNGWLLECEFPDTLNSLPSRGEKEVDQRPKEGYYQMTDNEFYLRAAWDRTCQERDELKKQISDLQKKATE